MMPARTVRAKAMLQRVTAGKARRRETRIKTGHRQQIGATAGAEMAGNQIVIKLAQRLRATVSQYAALPQQPLRLLLDIVQPGQPPRDTRLVSSFHAIRCSRVCSSARLLSPVSSIMRLKTGNARYARSGIRSPPRRGRRRNRSAENESRLCSAVPRWRRTIPA